MKIMIMGSGGVGAYYGGLLAKQGNDVTFIARGAHLEALRTNGLQVKSVHGDFSIVPAQATENPADVGTVDLILFCVKTYATDKAAEAIRPVVGPQTAVMSLQNGVDAAERIGNIIGVEHVLGGMTHLSSAIEAPGVVKQVSQFRRIVLGEFDGTISSRAKSIERVLNEAGIAADVSQNIRKVLWEKLIFISVAGGLGSLTRLPMGEWRKPPETRAMAVSLMKEGEAVARAEGVAVDADIVEKTLAFIDAAAPHIKASMQLDAEAGRQLEVESLIGVIGRKGRKAGIPTPTADMIYAALLPIHLKALESK